MKAFRIVLLEYSLSFSIPLTLVSCSSFTDCTNETGSDTWSHNGNGSLRLHLLICSDRVEGGLAAAIQRKLQNSIEIASVDRELKNVFIFIEFCPRNSPQSRILACNIIFFLKKFSGFRRSSRNMPLFWTANYGFNCMLRLEVLEFNENLEYPQGLNENILEFLTFDSCRRKASHYTNDTRH